MTRLRVLLLEDDPLDAQLTLACLLEGGFVCEALRVDTRAEFRARLLEDCPDLILADYSLPSFDGLEALRIAQEICPQVPFIFVSGALGEELAIETLKQGATDYVLKHRLERLIPSVQRALREAEDRAERQRLEEELRRRAEALAEADQRKDEFLAMLAHELRNPLAPIFNALHMMGMAEADPANVRKCRGVVERQVRLMARLLDDLLDISRIARGKILLQSEVVNLTQLVRDAAEDQRTALEGKGVTFRVQVPEEPLLVMGDPARLAQVVGNLLSNAAKFTPRGGTVTLEMSVRGDTACLQILDTGIGMSREALTHIFEPFAQERRALDQNRTGLGLGLALVKGLAQLHGGSVTAESEGPGHGSCFTVRLPLHRGTPATSEPGIGTNPLSRSAEGPGGANLSDGESAGSRKVLVIDDNRDAADSMAELLRLTGFAVEVAYSGPEGWELARRLRPEVVLCDLGLPGLDGFEIARRLRKGETGVDGKSAPGGSSATIGSHSRGETAGGERGEVGARRGDNPPALLIAVSGYGQEEDRRRSEEAGFDYHLTKPVDPAALQQLLSATVGD